MQVKCEYCGALIPDNLEKCPNCGAVNTNMQRSAIGIPQTIDELLQWYNEQNLPSFEQTRFFIGTNYTGARAFGIYQEGTEFIVYKNKSDGSRIIRYRGTDEDYAVNEIYLKLKSEIVNQKEQNVKKKSVSRPTEYATSQYRRPKKHKLTFLVILLILIIVSVISCSVYQSTNQKPNNSYTYHSNDGSVVPYFIPYLYDDGTTWWDNDDSNTYHDTWSNDDYSYNDDSSWSYDNDNDYSSYFDTWDNDWDSSYDWDSGDTWDSGWSDWDSDW